MVTLAETVGPERGRAAFLHRSFICSCFHVPAVPGHCAQRRDREADRADAVPLGHRAARLMAPGVWLLHPATLSGELRQSEPQSWGRVLGGGDVTSAGDAGLPCWLRHGRPGLSLLPHTRRGWAAWEAHVALRGSWPERVLFPGRGGQDSFASCVVQTEQKVPLFLRWGGRSTHLGVAHGGGASWRSEDLGKSQRGSEDSSQRCRGDCPQWDKGDGNETAREGLRPGGWAGRWGLGTRPLAGRALTRPQAAAAAGPARRGAHTQETG